MDLPDKIAERARALTIPLDGCHNFRAVADWRSKDGRRLKEGRLFRSDGLAQLSDRDGAKLSGLGLRDVIDLRDKEEITHAPSRWPDTMELRIWTGAESAADAEISYIMECEGLDASAFSASMLSLYSRFPVNLAQATRALGEAILAADCGATLVHCTAGKDRTGFVVAMLLHAIGIEPDEIMADYLLSDASYAAAYVRFNIAGRFDALDARAPGAVSTVLGVHPEYLQAAERRIADDFGSIDRWLETVAGLGPQQRELLAERLLN